MTVERPLSAAIIGCGKIAGGFAETNAQVGLYTHAQAYQASALTTLVAVCDQDSARAEAFAKRWGVARWYADPATMMAAEQPDLVSLCTPNDTHATLLLRLLEAETVPRGLLCEKPLAMSLADARRVVELARERGVHLAVNYMRRYMPHLREVRALVGSGELGDLQAVHGWYTKGVLHNGTHWFDLLRLLFGEVTAVAARPAGEIGEADGELDVSLRLANRGRATLTSCSAERFTIFEMDALLEGGRIELRDAALTARLFRARSSERFAGHTELREEMHDFGESRDALLHAVEDLAGAVLEGRAPACTGEDGVVALAIGQAALASARAGGRWMEVASHDGNGAGSLR